MSPTLEDGLTHDPKKNDGSETHTVYATKIKSKNLVVPVVIGSKCLNAVIDTAAQVSVVKNGLLTEFLSKKPYTSSNLQGIGKQKITAKKYDEINIQVGRTEYLLSIFTADIQDDMLLGIDFLDRYGVEIDFNRCQLVIEGERIKALVLRDSELKHHRVNRVKTGSKIRIDAQTVARVPLKLDEKFDEAFVFTPAGNSLCMMPCTLNAPGETVVVAMVNDSDNPVYIKEDTILGNVIAGEEMKGPRTSSRRVRTLKHVNKVKFRSLPEYLKDLYERSSKNLDEDQKLRLKWLLITFKDVFSAHELDLGHFTGLQHTITLEENAFPVKEKYRPTPQKFGDAEESNLNAMLEAGVIQPSSSPWCSASVLVRKKCGGVRWCQDFRKLNAMTKKDAFPLPLISSCYDSLQGNKYMSSLDLASGYWQLEIAPEDREKTAFITKYGLYEYVRMSMGLCNAPSTFQRAMNLVLRGLTWKSVLAFLDDVMVLGRTFDEHLENLQEVFERFQHHNLKLKPKKCALFQIETKFLGRIVTGDTVSVDPDSIDIVRDWPTPKCTRDVERFLGFANYNREHVPNLAEIAVPLYGLTGKNPFNWTDSHENAFNQIKMALLKPVILSLPTPDDVFVLDVDASDTAVAAQLSQIRDGTEVPISYGSKALTPAQRKYCATRKELLALIVFARQYRHYLLGRPFIARTDHSSLVWLTHFRYIQGQLARWLEELQQYNMQIVHRSGKMHVNCDALSRVPDQTPFCECYSAIEDISQLPCGGCQYCQRAHAKWSDFESNVDDVVELGIPVVRTVGLTSNWSDAIDPHMRAEKQREDGDLAKCIEWLQSPPSNETLASESPQLKNLWSNRACLYVDNGVLWYKWLENDGERSLFVVPHGLRTVVLGLAHDNTLAGHFGMKKTLERVRRSFYWPGMRQEIEDYIRSCFACNRSKHLRQRYRAPLQESTTGSPMEKVHIDIMGPLPRTERNNTYVVVMVDQFTKWIEVAAVPDQKAETVARAMVDNLICRFGCPKILFSDQGANLTGGLFSELCDRLGISKKRTTAYRASSNGQVERLNRSISQAIRSTISAVERLDQTCWDEKLQVIAGAIRSSMNRSTGYTPNRLMLGREVNQPLELMLGNEIRETSTAEYVQQLETDMRLSHAAARTALKSAQRRQRAQYDPRTYTTKYEVGDAILLANSATKIGECKKLQPLWLGPYLVVAKISDILYKVATQKKTYVIHHDRMRPCNDRSLPLWLTRKRSNLSECSNDILDETLGPFIDEPLYCYCRRPDDGKLMVACDGCGEWFHAKACLKLTKKQVDRMKTFFCQNCQS